MIKQYAFALSLLLPAAAFAQTAVTIPTVPLAAFQQSLGVNTHVNYTDGEYANVKNVLADLAYLGVSNVRDSLPNPGYDAGNADADRQQLAAAGIHFDFLTTCDQTLGIEKAGWDEYASKYPGSVLSIEGTNEINNAPCPGGTQAAAVQFQRAVYAAVKADPLVAKVPVLDFTGGAENGSEGGSLSGQADVLNTHPYPNAGQQPYARLQSDFQAIYGQNYGKMSSQITETGYQNFNYANGNLAGMDQLSVAEYGANAVFDSALEGNSHIYLYQLLQAYPNVQDNGDTAYGLFDYFNQPTLFAQFLHNLHAVLPADAASAPRGPISVGISGGMKGLPATSHLLALTTSSGYKSCPSCVAIFWWDEQPEFDADSDSNQAVAPVSRQILVPGYQAVGAVFPSSTTLLPVQQVGVYQGTPYYTFTRYGFPTGILFKPSR